MEFNKVFEKYFIPSSDTLNENRTVCKECGGQCCKSMGCHISPNDLREITVESVIALMDETNCISIDWYEGHPIDKDKCGPCYFLRIKNQGANMIDPSWGGQCCLLQSDGCPLLFQYRPMGGRTLQPNDDGKATECAVGYSKKQCAIDWLPYQDVLTKVYDHYKSLGLVTTSPLGDLFGLMQSFFGGPDE